MEANLSYAELAQAYADGVRGLMMPGAAAPGAAERGEAPPHPTADQAEALAPVSAQLIRAAATRLEDEDPQVRLLAASQLLAKAATDLEITALLLQAAEDEEAGILPAAPGAAERSVSLSTELQDRLDLITGKVSIGLPAIDRSGRAPTDPAKARLELVQAADDSLDLIRKRAAKTGQAAITGLLAMGAAELAQAAGVVGLNIATALGQAQAVTRLYTMVREFALSTYESLLAALGPAIAQTAASKVLGWANDVLQGEQFGVLLDKLYETAATQAEIEQRAQISQAGVEKTTAAQDALMALEANHKKQCDLADKLNQGLKWLAVIPAAALPQGQVLRAAAFIVLAAYVILSGADYVDAPRLKLIDRVPGVRVVTEVGLA